MTPPPRPWPGCWPPTAASPCSAPRGTCSTRWPAATTRAAGPNLGVYLKGHAGDLLKVDRRGRPPEYVERPCLTIGLTVQPEVLRGLAGRPGFGGRGLLARFLYSLPASLVGRRQPGAPPVPQPVADRYTLELQALAASLASSGRRRPRPCSPSTHKLASCCSAFERDLEPRLAADSGDLAHLAGWAAKLAGATCRLAALLHLASHLRDGWAQPISADTFAAAIRLADYLIEHARAVFDLMGADPRTDDARWLLDWIGRTNQVQFSRRDAHRAAPRGRFPKATDLEPALRLLEEHGYLRRVDPEPSRTRAAVADPPRRGSWSTLCRAPQKRQKPQKQPPELFLWILSFLRRVAGVPNEGRSARRGRVRRGGHGRSSDSHPGCHVIQRERPQPFPAMSPPASGRLRRPRARHGRR